MKTPTTKPPGIAQAYPLSVAVNSQPGPPTRGVLISFRNAEEAAPFAHWPIDVFDLKEPVGGPLGSPSPVVAEAFAESLRRAWELAPPCDELRWPRPALSLARGELFGPRSGTTDQDDAWEEIVESFDYVKYGLAGANQSGCWEETWLRRAESLRLRGCFLVPVCYLDATTCGAPSLEAVLQLCERVAPSPPPFPSTLLIDTFSKRQGRWCDWISTAEISDVHCRLADRGWRLAMAGSLQCGDVDRLPNESGWLLGARGAVCQAGDRHGAIDPTALKHFVSSVKQTRIR